MTDIDPTPLLSSTASDTQAALDAGLGLATPHGLGVEGTGYELGRFYAVTVPAGGELQVVDLEEAADRYRSEPRRKTGNVTVYDAASFVGYLAKHGLAQTEVYADVRAQSLVAVVNGHEKSDEDGWEGLAGWGDHRVTLRLFTTPAWDAWIRRDREIGGQVDFAEHVEDRLVDVVNPPGATMLELAQTFQATTKVAFESSKRLSSGERQLEYREQQQASAGRKGDVTIPDTFELGLVPYEGAERYKVTARLRYRIAEGSLRIGYVLDRPEEVLRSAFADIVAFVESGISHPVYRGVPA
ncbi:MAG: DUF2303 family protein [Actinomycetes bacterium]